MSETLPTLNALVDSQRAKHPTLGELAFFTLISSYRAPGGEAIRKRDLARALRETRNEKE